MRRHQMSRRLRKHVSGRPASYLLPQIAQMGSTRGNEAIALIEPALVILIAGDAGREAPVECPRDVAAAAAPGAAALWPTAGAPGLHARADMADDRLQSRDKGFVIHVLHVEREEKSGSVILLLPAIGHASSLPRGKTRRGSAK